TGSPAHRQMRTMPEISQDAIQRHCNAADFALWTMEGLGAFSLFSLCKFRSSEAVPPPLTAALLGLALLTLGLMIWVANLGGAIRHSEIAASSATEHFVLVFTRRPISLESFLPPLIDG